MLFGSLTGAIERALLEGERAWLLSSFPAVQATVVSVDWGGPSTAALVVVVAVDDADVKLSVLLSGRALRFSTGSICAVFTCREWASGAVGTAAADISTGEEEESALLPSSCWR